MVVEPMNALSPLESSPVAVSVPPPDSDNTTVRIPEPVPRELASSANCPLVARVVKLAGKFSEGVALILAVPCALAGQEMLTVERLVTDPSTPLSVTVSGWLPAGTPASVNRLALLR